MKRLFFVAFAAPSVGKEEGIQLEFTNLVCSLTLNIQTFENGKVVEYLKEIENQEKLFMLMKPMSSPCVNGEQAGNVASVRSTRLHSADAALMHGSRSALGSFIQFAEVAGKAASLSGKPINCDEEKQLIGTYKTVGEQKGEDVKVCIAIEKRHNFLRKLIEHLVFGQPVKVPDFLMGPDESADQMVEIFITFPGQERSFFPSYKADSGLKAGTVIRGSGGPSQWTLYGIGQEVSKALRSGEENLKLFSDFIYLTPKIFYARLSETKNFNNFVQHTGGVKLSLIQSENGAAYVYKVKCNDVGDYAPLMGEYIERGAVLPFFGMTSTGDINCHDPVKVYGASQEQVEACKLGRGICSQLVSFSEELYLWTIPTPALSSSWTILQTGFEKIEYSFVKDDRFIMPFKLLDPPPDISIPSDGHRGENKFLQLIGGPENVKCILTLYHLDDDRLKEQNIESVVEQLYAGGEKALACLTDSKADGQEFKTKIDAILIDRSEEYSAINCIGDGKILAKLFHSPGGEELYDMMALLKDSDVKPEKIIIHTSNNGQHEKDAINQCKRMIAIRSRLIAIVEKGKGEAAIASSKEITEKFAFGKRTNEKEGFSIERSFFPIRAVAGKEPEGDVFRITKMDGLKFCELSLFGFSEVSIAEKELGESVKMYAPPCGSDVPVQIVGSTEMAGGEKNRLIVVSDYDSKSGEYFSIELFNESGTLDMVYSAWILDGDNTIFRLEETHHEETEKEQNIVVINKMREYTYAVDSLKLVKLVDKLYNRFRALKLALVPGHTREEKAANTQTSGIQPMVMHRKSSGKFEVLIPHSRPPKDGPTAPVDEPKSGGRTLLAISDSRCTLQFAGLPEISGHPINELIPILVAAGIEPCFGAVRMHTISGMGGIAEVREEGKNVNAFCTFDFQTNPGEKIQGSALFTFRNDDSSIFQYSDTESATRFSDFKQGGKVDVSERFCLHMKILFSKTANTLAGKHGKVITSSGKKIFNEFQVSISSIKEGPLSSSVEEIFEKSFFVLLPFPTRKAGEAITLEKNGKNVFTFYGPISRDVFRNKNAFIEALRKYSNDGDWLVSENLKKEDLKLWPNLAVDKDVKGLTAKRLLDSLGRVVLEKQFDFKDGLPRKGFKFDVQNRVGVQPQCLLLVGVEGHSSSSYSNMVSTVSALRDALVGSQILTVKGDETQRKDIFFDVIIMGNNKWYDYSVIQRMKDWRQNNDHLIVEFPPVTEEKPKGCQIQLVVESRGVVYLSLDALAEMNYQVSRNPIYSDFTSDNGCIDLNELRRKGHHGNENTIQTHLVWEEGKSSSRITVSCSAGDEKFGEYVTQFSEMEIREIPGFQFWEKEFMEIAHLSEVGATSSERFAVIRKEESIFTKTCQHIWDLKKLFKTAHQTVVHSDVTSEREEEIQRPTALLESVYRMGGKEVDVTKSEIRKFFLLEASQKRYVSYSSICGIAFFGEMFEKEEKVENFFKSRFENICDPKNKFAAKPSEWFGKDDEMWVKVQGLVNNRKISFSRILDLGSSEPNGGLKKVWEVVLMLADDVSLLFEEGSAVNTPRGRKTVGTFKGTKISEKWIEENIMVQFDYLYWEFVHWIKKETDGTNDDLESNALINEYEKIIAFPRIRTEGTNDETSDSDDSLVYSDKGTVSSSQDSSSDSNDGLLGETIPIYEHRISIKQVEDCSLSVFFQNKEFVPDEGGTIVTTLLKNQVSPCLMNILTDFPEEEILSPDEIQPYSLTVEFEKPEKTEKTFVKFSLLLGEMQQPREDKLVMTWTVEIAKARELMGGSLFISYSQIDNFRNVEESSVKVVNLLTGNWLIVKKRAEKVIANLLCVKLNILGTENRCGHLRNGGAQFTNVELEDAFGNVENLYPLQPNLEPVRTIDSYSLKLVKGDCETEFSELPAGKGFKDLFESPNASAPFIRLLQMEPICVSSSPVEGEIYFSVEILPETGGGLNVRCYDETGQMVGLAKMRVHEFKSYPRFVAADSEAGKVCLILFRDRKKLLDAVQGGKKSFLKNLEEAQKIGKLPIGFRENLFDSMTFIEWVSTGGEERTSNGWNSDEIIRIDTALKSSGGKITSEYSSDNHSFIKLTNFDKHGNPFCSMMLDTKVAGTFYAFRDQEKLNALESKFEKLFGHSAICAISKGSFGDTYFIDGRSFKKIDPETDNEIFILEQMLGIEIRVQFEYLQNGRVDREAPKLYSSPKPDGKQMMNLFYRLWVAVFEAEQFNFEKKLDIFSILPSGENFANVEASANEKCTEQFIGIQVADFKDGDALERIAANVVKAQWLCNSNQKANDDFDITIPKFSSSGFCSSHRAFLICEFHMASRRVWAFRHQSKFRGCEEHSVDHREKACASLFRNFVRIQTAVDSPRTKIGNIDKKPILSFISKILPSVSGLFFKPKSDLPAPQSYRESVFEIFQSVGVNHDFHLDHEKIGEIEFKDFHSEVDAPTEFRRKDQTCSESFASSDEGFKKFFKLSPGLDGAQEYATAVSRTRAAPCVPPGKIEHMINAIKHSESVTIEVANIECNHDEFLISCKIKKNGVNTIISTRKGTIVSGKSNLCNEVRNSDALKNECFASYFLSDALHRELSAVRPRSRSQLETEDHWVPIPTVGTTDVSSEGIHLSQKLSSSGSDIIGIMASEKKKEINEPKCIVRFEVEHESKPLTVNKELFLQIIKSNLCQTTLVSSPSSFSLPKLAEPTYGRKRSQDKFEISCFYLHGKTELKLTRDLVRASQSAAENHPFCVSAGEGGCDFFGNKPPENLVEICDGLLQIYLYVAESPVSS